MEQLMNEDPIQFYAIGYVLVSILTWLGFCKSYEIPPQLLPLPQMMASLFWPLAIVFGLIMFLVLMVAMFWDWLTTHLKRDKLEEQLIMEENK